VAVAHRTANFGHCSISSVTEVAQACIASIACFVKQMDELVSQQCPSASASDRVKKIHHRSADAGARKHTQCAFHNCSSSIAVVFATYLISAVVTSPWAPPSNRKRPADRLPGTIPQPLHQSLHPFFGRSLPVSLMWAASDARGLDRRRLIRPMCEKSCVVSCAS
jgi:hypothetical protein